MLEKSLPLVWPFGIYNDETTLTMCFLNVSFKRLEVLKPTRNILQELNQP